MAPNEELTSCRDSISKDIRTTPIIKDKMPDPKIHIDRNYEGFMVVSNSLC